MQFAVQSINISRIPLGPKGTIAPICTRCSNTTCTNPIEWKKIVLFGVTQKHRVFMKGRDMYFVIGCPEGFIDGILEENDEPDA